MHFFNQFKSRAFHDLYLKNCVNIKIVYTTFKLGKIQSAGTLYEFCQKFNIPFSSIIRN